MCMWCTETSRSCDRIDKYQMIQVLDPIYHISMGEAHFLFQK